MSRSHFVKQLSYALISSCCSPKPIFSHHLAHPTATPLLAFFINRKASELCTPNSCPANNSASLSSLSSATSETETPYSESFTWPYLSVRIRCPSNVADTLSEALLCFGASSTTIDEKDVEESSDETCIDSIFPEGHDVNTCILDAADSIGLKDVPNYVVKKGEQYDWIRKTQESFNPVEVTEGLWIVPEWMAPPDVRATNIMLNPGLAFGTGEHPTTKLCLLLLHSLIKGGELFLDYGTGSGILAIAALKFGADNSVGIDIDPQAITSARQNAALNNIGSQKMQLHMVPGKTFSPSIEAEKYDIVVANILLNPLLDLAEDIIYYAKPGAVVALSGILSEQLPRIIERYSQFLEGVSVSEMDDWACVHGTKKRNRVSVD
ncbi:hypothetical protein FNV43_RR15930 [Rhamnella rubrinervis]|uniref:ETFB lysine methyltransferase n=1 Tax=Rhamnella rubrinervis TaxID=2594499 RepID=A0A8K0GX62_9ROSA|nr:hypothetical protein FNV43_RR15930 [Rhamnella rubrinervis]